MPEAVRRGKKTSLNGADQVDEPACPSCTETLLQMGEDGEMEVKEEYRGKLRYLAEAGYDAWLDHRQVVPIAVLENEPGKLN